MKYHLRTYVCTIRISYCSILQMRVTGNNLQNACKLIFTISKDERNDPFFASEQLIGKVPICLHCIYAHVRICTFIFYIVYVHTHVCMCNMYGMFVCMYVTYIRKYLNLCHMYVHF